MKKYILGTSSLALTAFILLFSGCQSAEDTESVKTISTMEESIGDGIQTVDKEVNSIDSQTISMERLTLEHEYDIKLVECYSKDNIDCSSIVGEMIDAEMELEQQEMIAQEQQKIEEEMKQEIISSQTLTQGEYYAK